MQCFKGHRDGRVLSSLGLWRWFEKKGKGLWTFLCPFLLLCPFDCGIISSRGRGRLRGFLELRRPWEFSPEARRGSHQHLPPGAVPRLRGRGLKLESTWKSFKEEKSRPFRAATQLRLVISLYLANHHTLGPTKLLLQPHPRVGLGKKLGA